MYINGGKVKELRQYEGISRTEFADMLAIDTSVLRKYEEEIEEWYEEDVFRLLTLQEVLSEPDFLLNYEYLEMLEELAEEYE